MRPVGPKADVLEPCTNTCHRPLCGHVERNLRRFYEGEAHIMLLGNNPFTGLIGLSNGDRHNPIIAFGAAAFARALDADMERALRLVIDHFKRREK